MQDSRKALFLLFISLAIVGGGFFMYLAVRQTDTVPAFATVLPEPLPLPEFSLLDHDGGVFSRESFRGQWSLVFFGFTHCPDICPATLQQLSLAREQLGAAEAQPLPQILLISVDPERDTPEVLSGYVEHFGAGVIGVGGELAELKKLTSALGIYFEKSAVTDDHYSVDHSAVVVVINPDAEFHAVFSAPHSVDRFAADIPRIAGSG